ncbi:MAG: arsenite efflux transporter metallochaperone ArsD [Halobacteriota archaeon]
MTKIDLIIYEGAMCCSTGICGPEPDKVLIEFNETLQKIQHEFNEVNVVRASISFNVNMFLEKSEIIELVKEQGPEVLPITTINGSIIAKQRYLTYAELKKSLEERGAK